MTEGLEQEMCGLAIEREAALFNVVVFDHLHEHVFAGHLGGKENQDAMFENLLCYSFHEFVGVSAQLISVDDVAQVVEYVLVGVGSRAFHLLYFVTFDQLVKQY